MNGLDKFINHFKGYEDNYVVIGGTACSVLFEEAGLDFRATKDIDIVILVENINVDFANHFWEFIRLDEYIGKYESSNRRNFYRFEKPQRKDFPKMIELFSRKPYHATIFENSHLIPLHIAQDISSLSAILLDDDYYDFLKHGIRIVSGISLLDAGYLIPFKAKAYCELTERSLSGELGLTRHIKKHKKDIMVLYDLIKPLETITIKGNVRRDMNMFINSMREESNTDDIDDVLKGLIELYLL